MAIIGALIAIGIFVLTQTGIAIFWAGRHSERAANHAKEIESIKGKQDEFQEKQEASREVIRVEVRAALESWQEARGEKMEIVAVDLKELENTCTRGFKEVHEAVSSVSREMQNQHHRIRAVERHTGIQTSEPRFPALGNNPTRDPRREPR